MKDCVTSVTQLGASQSGRLAAGLSLRVIVEEGSRHDRADRSLRQLAALSQGARRLSAKVRKETSTELVSTEVSTETKAPERQIVEQAAATIVQVVRE